jgi:hypothetical protein
MRITERQVRSMVRRLLEADRDREPGEQFMLAFTKILEPIIKDAMEGGAAYSEITAESALSRALSLVLFRYMMTQPELEDMISKYDGEHESGASMQMILANMVEGINHINMTLELAETYLDLNRADDDFIKNIALDRLWYTRITFEMAVEDA